MAEPVPYRYTIDPARRLVVIEYAPPAPFERWLATMDLVLADADYRPDYWFLGDRRSIHEPPSIQYAENIVRYFAANPSHWAGVRWANVVPSGEPAMYGMGRMIELLAEGAQTAEVRTFTAMDDALDWVSRPPRDGPS